MIPSIPSTTSFLFAVATLCAPLASEPAPGPWVSDQGDGTYKNPVLYADYSDPDAIRVGDDYWLTASSFFHSPGLPILHSKDLVNWTIVNHALPVIPPADHYKAFQRGCGVYAPSIRHHDGQFWIYYGDPDFGVYLVTAKDPRGKWSEPVLVKEAKGIIDPCPIWDDDGKAYLVYAGAGSRGGRTNRLMLHEMSPDGTKLIGEGKTIIKGSDFSWKVVEGPKLYKRDEWYWVFAPAGGVGTGFQAVFRSKNIWGPYEARNVLDQGSTEINGPHQGAWIDTPSGKQDWFLHFQKAWAPGRIMHLQPMRWSDDGWPVMGHDADGDGRGEPVLVHAKPDIATQPVATPATTDEFNEPELGLQWQWQANPDAGWYDLADEPGSLVLNCVPQVSADRIADAPNLLLQKLPAPGFTATTVLDFAPKADGDSAGLTVFGNNYSWLGLRQIEGQTKIVLASYRGKRPEPNPAVVSDTIDFDGKRIHLRVVVSPKWRCRFEWSADGETFARVGKREFKASHLGWVGGKVGVFATSAPGAPSGGHAQFDWFRVTGYEAP